jgi:hypothetical protein
VVVAVLGVVAGVAVMVASCIAYDDAVDGFQRVDAPGTGHVTLDPGDYTAASTRCRWTG